MRTFLPWPLATAALLTGCTDAGLPAEVAKLTTQVATLTTQVAALQTEVAKQPDMQKEIDSLSEQHFKLLFSGPQDTVSFDPQDEQAYQAVRAPAGPVLVILEKVVPYLDGFTVYLRLGNPTSVGYDGVTGTVNWGHKLDFKKGGDYNKLAKKEVDLKNFLAPGTWTVVKFNVAPAKPEQVRRIIFSPKFNTVRMRLAAG